MKFGLIGHPVTHSFSKKYFEEKRTLENADSFSYDLLDAASLEVVSNFLRQDYAGFNVTIPYKVSILPLLDELSDEAYLIGAVNTLVRTAEGKWKGYNTDAIGFSDSLLTWTGTSLPSRALILGNGGASKAIQFALDQLDIECLVVTRDDSGDLGYARLSKEIILDHHLIINTTPVGMVPHTYVTVPFPFEFVGPQHWVYDLIYNPANTLFLALGQKAGAKTKNGLEMLHLQADHSWAIWKSYGTI